MLKIKPLKNYFKGIYVNNEYAIETIDETIKKILNNETIINKINIEICERHLMSNIDGINIFIEIIKKHIDIYVKNIPIDRDINEITTRKEIFSNMINTIRKLFRKILYTIKNKKFITYLAIDIFNDKILKPIFLTKKKEYFNIRTNNHLIDLCKTYDKMGYDTIIEFIYINKMYDIIRIVNNMILTFNDNYTKKIKEHIYICNKYGGCGDFRNVYIFMLRERIIKYFIENIKDGIQHEKKFLLPYICDDLLTKTVYHKNDKIEYMLFNKNYFFGLYKIRVPEPFNTYISNTPDNFYDYEKSMTEIIINIDDKTYTLNCSLIDAFILCIIKNNTVKFKNLCEELNVDIFEHHLIRNRLYFMKNIYIIKYTDDLISLNNDFHKNIDKIIDNKFIEELIEDEIKEMTSMYEPIKDDNIENIDDQNIDDDNDDIIPIDPIYEKIVYEEKLNE